MIKTTLGQVADIITGPFGSSLHQYEYVSFGIPVIMPQDIGNRNLSYEKIAYITQEKANELSRYLVDTNDIVYARRGDIEKHAFITDNDKDAICGTGCLRVRIMDKNVNPLFLSFYLNKPETKKWISLHAVGSSMPNINSEILSKVPIVLPDKREQDSIASFLDNIDNKISNNNDICSDLESMAKLLYDYWFVQFDFPDENGKPYKSSGGKMVWNEELKREIPDGWSAKKLSKIADIVTTSITTENSSYYLHYSIPAFDENKMPSNDKGDAIDSNKYLVPDNAVLVSKLNPHFQRVWWVGKHRKNSICSTEFMPFVAQTNIYEYLYSLLKSEQFYTFMVNSSSSSTGSRKRMQPDLCLDFMIPYPDDDRIIHSYCSITNPVLQKVSESLKENQQLASLRDFLLPMLMNGQVKVKEGETQ